MFANALDFMEAILTGMGNFLTPTTGEGGLTAGQLAALGAIFALPIVGGLIVKVRKLIKSAR